MRGVWPRPAGGHRLGGLIVAVDSAQANWLLRSFMPAQIRAACIGKVLPAEDGLFMIRGDRREELSRFDSDEIAQIFSRPGCGPCPPAHEQVLLLPACYRSGHPTGHPAHGRVSPHTPAPGALRSDLTKWPSIVGATAESARSKRSSRWRTMSPGEHRKHKAGLARKRT